LLANSKETYTIMSTNEAANTVTNVVGDMMHFAESAMADPGGLMDKVAEWLAHYGLKVLAALLVLVIGRIIARFLQKTIRNMMMKSKMDEGLVHFTASISYVGLMTFVIIAALGQLGVQTASFIAVLGAATFAIGLALQGSLANFAAGVLMLIFRPFRVGNYIEGAGVAGSVMKIEIFTTTLKTPDNKLIIVPNAKLTNDNITNYSQQEQRRIEIIASCGYDDDVRAVKACLEKMLKEEPRVLEDPAPFV